MDFVKVFGGPAEEEEGPIIILSELLTDTIGTHKTLCVQQRNCTRVNYWPAKVEMPVMIRGDLDQFG